MLYHFYFFVVLAMLAGFCERKVLLIAAGLTAIHHLILNYLIPNAIYPEGENLLRLAVHAWFVVVETGMLIFFAGVIRASFAEAVRMREEAASSTARSAAEAAKREEADRRLQAQITAIGKSQAMVEFRLDGTVLTANENFLHAFGYSLAEISGQHHRIFVDPLEREQPEYHAFWDALRRGKFQAAEYKRYGKGGRRVWIQATYNPIFDADGRPVSIVKLATDITTAVKDRERRAGIQRAINSDLEKITSAIATADRKSSNAASAAKLASNNVQAVADGTRHLADSIEEISRQVNGASRISADAKQQGDIALDHHAQLALPQIVRAPPRRG